MKIFIGSVFEEPKGTYWELRKKIYEQLKNQGHTPWLWEIEGEEEKKVGVKNGTEIVSDAISKSDLVIAFYKTRAGDPSREWNPDKPFYPLDFEIAEAIKRKIQLRVFVIKSKII